MSPTKDVKRQRRWQFWIDRGGTFTDCLGRDPDTGEIREVKVLSSDRAPLIGIRRLLGVDGNTPIPPCEVRTGTTPYGSFPSVAARAAADVTPEETVFPGSSKPWRPCGSRY